MHALDQTDLAILRQLRGNARISNAALAEAVGLSASACLRRVRLLEQRGVIRGYTVLLAAERAETPAPPFIVFVQVTLERQTDEHLRRLEEAVRRLPEVRECHLMTGDADYLLRIEARDPADYERIHKDQLSRLPGVARIQSSFAIRSIIRG